MPASVCKTTPAGSPSITEPCLKLRSFKSGILKEPRLSSPLDIFQEDSKMYLSLL